MALLPIAPKRKAQKPNTTKPCNQTIHPVTQIFTFELEPPAVLQIVFKAPQVPINSRPHAGSPNSNIPIQKPNGFNIGVVSGFLFLKSSGVRRSFRFHLGPPDGWSLFSSAHRNSGLFHQSQKKAPGASWISPPRLFGCSKADPNDGKAHVVAWKWMGLW